MARMTWNPSFDFKSLRISKSKISGRGVFSSKWISRKSKEAETSDSNTSSPPGPGVTAAVVAVPSSVVPPPPTVIPVSTPPAVDTETQTSAGPVPEEPKEVETKLTEFTCFPSLPAELRCKIWKHAAFIPRNVNVWSCDFGKKISIPLTDNEDPDEGDVLVIWKLSSTTPAPAILHTSNEARTEGLKHYKLDFGTSYTFRDFSFKTHPRIYFNFNVDRLCLMESFEGENSRACKNFFDRLLTNGTRYVALNIKRFQEDPKRECSYIRPWLTKCMERGRGHSLKNIILASPEYNREMRGEIEFKEPSVREGVTTPVASVNTGIMNGLRDWVREKEKVHKSLDTGSGVEIQFQTLVINGKECTE